MTDLDKKFGADRIIDTPVSEAAVTGAAVGPPVWQKTHCGASTHGLYALRN